MPTTSQGIYYPDSTTNVAPLHTVFSTMASSIDDILAGDVQIHRVANTTARNALVAQFPPSAANPLFVWRADATNGQELEYTKNGTTWHYVNTSEDDTGWVNVPLRSGFTNNVDFRVRRIGGVVHSVGRVNGSYTTSNQIIGDVSTEFRPFSAHRVPITFGTSAAILGHTVITAAGEVYVAAQSSTTQPANLYLTWTAA